MLSSHLRSLLPTQLFLLLFFLVAVRTTTTSTNKEKELLDDESWTHHLVLDREDKFHLHWRPDQDSITFEIQARTLGYVAIGFSSNGGMKGADVFLAWINDSGDLVAHDRFAEDMLTPVIDASQDFDVLGGYENGTHTVVRFSRKWVTCDKDQDRELGSDTLRLIWAYHPEDPHLETVLPYHGRLTRGARSVYLKEKPNSMSQIRRVPNVKAWEVRSNNLMLPSDDHTHYWCQIFKAPELNGTKHHMVGFEPIIQPGHESYVHHMVMYECHVPESSAEKWFERHASSRQGERCYSPNMPPEWTFCLATNTWAWAVGSEGEFLPSHVGIPLGEASGGATYFMLETHYDNPAMHRDVADSSGLRIFYTDLVRQFDAAMLLVGAEVNFLHVIPPEQEDFVSVGRCASECTNKGLPATGIRILNGVLHSHLAGRKIRLRHVRQGKELPVILKDESYDFNFQASREPELDTWVLPGDELLLECDYKTSGREGPTFGGLSTREEMCLGFIHYYPRSPLADCRSLPTLKTVMAAFGIESIYGKSFEKLALFLKDIGGSEESGTTLQELLHILALETGSDLTASSFHNNAGSNAGNLPKPLTEEDILNKPFYTVEEENDQQQIVAQELKDYRNIMSDMLLTIRIKSPAELHNKTIGEHFSSMNWNDPETGQAIQKKLMYGLHNNLCLAHGREPLIEYKEVKYPSFQALQPQLDDECLLKTFPKESALQPMTSKSSFMSTYEYNRFSNDDDEYSPAALSAGRRRNLSTKLMLGLICLIQAISRCDTK